MPPRPPLPRLTNPAILPIAPRTFGNNVPKSLHKTRRSWWPNVTRANLTVNVLDGLPLRAATFGGGLPSVKGKERATGDAASSPAAEGPRALRGVKIAVRDLKDVDKAGGVEGLLASQTRLSRPAKDFTPYGQKLRAELFRRLHDQRDQQLFESATKQTAPLGAGVGGAAAAAVGRI